MIELWAFQQLAVAKILNRPHPVINVAPTGSGKTLIASEVIRRSENSLVLFLAHRRELIHQCQAKLHNFGIDAGLILAGEPRDTMRRVQVASVQTLASRCLRRGEELPPAQLVIVDEAHHCPAATYQRILEQYPNAKLVGLTATPCRRDGRGLGGIFKELVECPQIGELIHLGHLVGTKVYAPSVPDLTGVRTRAGDYNEEQLAAAMDRSALVGDIVTHWHRLANRRPTVVFATSVGHSVHIRDEFKKAASRPNTSTAQLPMMSAITSCTGYRLAMSNSSQTAWC
jgi:DNA repair protein RadD